MDAPPVVIVSLGAGMEAGRSGRGIVGVSTRLRAIAASLLHRALPGSVLLFAGGRTRPGWIAESAAMKRYVTRSRLLRVPHSDVWTEEESLDTAGNVAAAVRLLEARGARGADVILVTDRRQLDRAAGYFAARGVGVTPVAASAVLSSALWPFRRPPPVIADIPPRGWRGRVLALLDTIDPKGRLTERVQAWRRGK